MCPVSYVQVDLRPSYALVHTDNGDVRLPRNFAMAVADTLLGTSVGPCSREHVSNNALRVSWPFGSMILPAVQAPVLAHLLRDWAVA